MFDWSDQDQVGDTIWGDFRESEDHIVPYPKGTEKNSLCSFGDYKKKQRTEQAGTIARSVGQTSGAKNDFAECNLQNNSGFTRNEELSAPRLDMDIWPELLSLSAALNKGNNHENDQDSLETGLLNTFTGASNVNKTRVQLDGAPELFGNEYEDKETDNFLDCVWANFSDFDDLDRIFRNSDSIFDHEMVGSADEFMPPSTDVIGGTAQSIPIPDIPSNKDEPSDPYCSSFPNAERSGGKRNREEKITDCSVKTEERTLCQTHVTGEYHGTTNQSTEKVDVQKKLLRSRKKAEERNKNKASQNFDSAWSHNSNQTQQATAPKVHGSLTTPLQTFQSPVISQQRQFGADSMGHPSPSSQFMFSGYGYSMYTYPAIPQMPLVHGERNQRKPISVGYKYYPDPVKHSEAVNKLPDVSKQSTMTPQEKIEKLRRRQQMLAMLAIQQQRQQFGQKSQSQDAVTSTIAVDENVNKSPSSELNMLEQDESQSVFVVIDDTSLAETIFSPLQDALGKLDIKVRLCIRDSLFRLAKSAMERQNACDRSSTNRSNRDEDEVPVIGETNLQDRSSKLSDTETDTNPIDRIVAHLLFHRPSESCSRPVKEEIPNSPVSCNPVSKPSLNTCGSTSQEQAGSCEEMEVQAPL